MNNKTIDICVCLSPKNDNRSTEEQTATLESFYQLHSGIQFHFAEYIDPPEIRALRGQPDYEKARELVTPPSTELKQALAKANIIFCVDLPFDMHLLAPNLQWVQSVGAGVAQLQHSGLDKLDCLLTNGAGITAQPIAEFIIARILSHWKLFSFYADNQQQHLWKQAFGRDLAGCTLGVVGYGAIGQATAQKAKALGMNILATRRQIKTGAGDSIVSRFYPITELDNMLKRCDAVVLSAAETPETYHLFNHNRFSAMPKGSYFCNISRGSLVDEVTLIDALKTGHLSGASIDVAENEPLPEADPLWDTPNLAISPHCSPSVENFSRHSWQLFYENMQRFLDRETLKNLRSCSVN